jgi:hypothetical protein
MGQAGILKLGKLLTLRLPGIDVPAKPLSIE